MQCIIITNQRNETSKWLVVGEKGWKGSSFERAFFFLHRFIHYFFSLFVGWLMVILHLMCTYE